MLKLLVVVIGMVVSAGIVVAQQLDWKEMAELPRPVAGYMAGFSRGKLVIIGGSYWENKEKHWCSQVQIFDPKQNTWTNGIPLPAPRSDAASATLNNEIYIFGGGSGTNLVKQALVLRDAKWAIVPSAELPEPRLYAAAVSSGGYIYLLGGIAKAGDYKNMSNTFWRWRPGLPGWERLPSLPGPGRISHAMADMNGDIYVFGGAGSGPQDVANLNDAYRFDPSSRKWIRLPDLSVANRSWWAVGLSDRALVLAGYTDTYASDVYWYIPGLGLKSAGALPHGLADIKFFHVGDVIVGAGGEAGPGVRGKWTIQAKLPPTNQNESSK